MTHPINLAVEDELSEQVMRRVIRDHARNFEVGVVFRKNGASYLKQRLSAFRRASRIAPYLMLTDLDRCPCPPDMIQDWFRCSMDEYVRKKNRSFLFCIAVREVETWILSDRVAFARLLGVSTHLIPAPPEAIPDPKQTLIQLAQRSRFRQIREGIAPSAGSILKTGPEYNERLGDFVRQSWSSQVAAKYSPSLRRAIERLTQLPLPKYR
jgi:hypothetical protein